MVSRLTAGARFRRAASSAISRTLRRGLDGETVLFAGNLPISRLLGCGFPTREIERLADLLTTQNALAPDRARALRTACFEFAPGAMTAIDGQHGVRSKYAMLTDFINLLQ